MPNVCGQCGSPAIAQWRRRLTDAELADLTAAETARREQILLLSDPEQIPAFGPMPGADDSTRSVFACPDHAIHLDLAAHIHAADCQAPHPDHLPECDCQPEPHPAPYEPPTMTVLPTGWTVPTLKDPA